MEAKKVDLLGFQRNLNEQFMEIFDSKKQGKAESKKSTDLGLVNEAGNFTFFISLKELQNISMNNNYEESKLLASWICGFNQIRGEVFTILDFQRVIEYLLDNINDHQYKKIDNENRIIYLKEYSKEKLGLVLEDITLAYTPEFTLLFKEKLIDGNKFWELNEDLEFNIFVKLENMKDKEYEILNILSAKKIKSDYSEDALKEMFFYLISDVYLDGSGKRPIFVINIENLTKVLINISPLQ